MTVHDTTLLNITNNGFQQPHLVTLDQQLTSIAQEAECLDWHTGTYAFDHQTQLLSKTFGLVVGGTLFSVVLEFLVVSSSLAYLGRGTERVDIKIFIC